MAEEKKKKGQIKEEIEKYCPGQTSSKTPSGFFIDELCIDEIDVWQNDKIICSISLPERIAEFVYRCPKCSGKNIKSKPKSKPRSKLKPKKNGK